MSIHFFVRGSRIMAVLMVALFAFGLLSMRLSAARIHQARETQLVSLALSRETSDNSYGLTANVRSYVASGNPLFKDNYFKILDIRSGKIPRPAEAAVAPGRQVELNRLYDEAGFTAAEKASLQEANRLSGELAKLEVEAMEAVENAGPEEWMAASRRASEILHGQSYLEAARAIQIPVGEFERLLAERLEKASLAAEDTEKRYFSLLAFVSALSGLLVLLAVTWMGRRIDATLGAIVGNLDETSARVAGASDSIRKSSLELSDGTNRQAAGLKETSASLEEMASMTRQNAESAKLTSQTTAHTVQLIDAGVKDVDRMSEAMREISDSAEKISRIIKTIEGIAFQTNLLALNAAVEAARAGEAGQGFAVVADEVRNLAQSAAGAAHDTAALIEGTVARVKNGSEIAAAMDCSFREIEAGAKEVGGLIVEISASTSEQAHKVDQVNTAVALMDKATQSNAAGAGACASASEELASQAARLKSMVAELTSLVVGGRVAESIPPRPAGTVKRLAAT